MILPNIDTVIGAAILALVGTASVAMARILGHGAREQLFGRLDEKTDALVVGQTNMQATQNKQGEDIKVLSQSVNQVRLDLTETNARLNSVAGVRKSKPLIKPTLNVMTH